MTMLPERVTPLHYQRRIARRYPIEMTLSWAPTGRRRRRRSDRTCQATTANVSLTGIGFESAARPGVEHGSPVTITIGDVRCTGSVRFTQPGMRPATRYYGVEIDDSEMMATLQRAIDDYRHTHARHPRY